MFHMYMTDFAYDGPIFLVPMLKSVISKSACIPFLIIQMSNPNGNVKSGNR